MERDKKWTHFRNWVHNLWLENCEEHFESKQPPYHPQDYWNKYKYWLKREYKHQQKQ